MDKDCLILKYDKDISVKTGALSYKMYVFMFSIVALLLLISSAIFDVVCNISGFSDVIIDKYVFKLVYISLFVIVVWLLNIPVWLPGYFAENSIIVKKDGKLYKAKYKKDNMEDKKISDEELLYLITNNKKGEEFSKIEKFDEYKIIKKKKRYAVVSVKYNKNDKVKSKKIRIYNIYDNFLGL